MTAKAPVISDLTVDLDRREVRRHLGYGSAADRAEGAAERRSEARLDLLWADAIGLLRPRGAWRVVDAAAAVSAGVPECVRPAVPLVGVGVCTIGPLLEAESAARAEAGELLDALILDAIGSAAAEAAADAVNLALCVEARSRRLHAAPRVSPGYGSWDVACQSRLLALLPIEAVGVSLTSGQMMVPRKSVSFAVGFTVEPPEDAAGSPCDRCGLTRCRHRAG